MCVRVICFITMNPYLSFNGVRTVIFQANRKVYCLRLTKATGTIEIFDVNQFLSNPEYHMFRLSPQQWGELETTTQSHLIIAASPVYVMASATLNCIANHVDGYKDYIMFSISPGDGSTPFYLLARKEYLQ